MRIPRGFDFHPMALAAAGSAQLASDDWLDHLHPVATGRKRIWEMGLVGTLFFGGEGGGDCARFGGLFATFSSCFWSTLSCEIENISTISLLF